MKSNPPLPASPPAPANPAFMIIPSLACPAECSYCFGPRRGAVMTAAQAEATLDFISRIAAETRQPKISVTFHGGEPLLAGHEVWLALLQGLSRRFSRQRLKLSVQSNLWLLDDEFCRLFKAYNVEVGTSLDGPEHITDRQRGREYFKRTMQGIHLARKHRLPVDGIATFTAQSLRAWREVCGFYLAAGLPFSIHAGLPPLRGEAGGLTVSPRDYGDVLIKTLGFYLRRRNRTQIHSLDQMIQSVAFASGRVCTFRPCLGMFLAVDPHGDIYPCQRFCGQPEFRLGALSDRPSWRDLFQSPVALRMQAREREIEERCRACEHLEYCRGGCTYNAWAQERPEAVDPYCQAYRRFFTVVKKRLRREMADPANLEAIADRPFSGKGHPLLRAGALSELCQPDAHPFRLRQKALEIVAAVLLARMPSADSAAEQLVRLGLCDGPDQARDRLQRITEKLFRTEPLNNFYLYITYRCQLQCNHCYLYSADFIRPEIELDPERVETFIRQAKAAGFRQAVILGGEPLLHRRLPELLRRLWTIREWAAPMNLVLRTNFAMPLSPEILSAAAAAADQIVVSVDGDETLHDARRGRGSYAKTVRNLRAYQEQQRHNLRAAELSLAAVLPAGEIRGEPGQSVRRLADALHIRRVRFRPLLPLGRAGEWQNPPLPETLCGFTNPSAERVPNVELSRTCGLGQNTYVAPDGDVFPCYAFCRPESRIGNLTETPLTALLDSGAFRALRQSTVDTRSGCRTCSVRYICGGACRAWAGKAAGTDYNAPPVDCRKQKEQCQAALNAAAAFLGINLEID